MPKNRTHHIQIKQDHTKVEYQVKAEWQPKEEPEVEIPIKEESISATEVIKDGEYIIPKRAPRNTYTDPVAGSKNVVKNFGKQMASFSCSVLSMPYLVPLAQQFNVTTSGFLDWIEEHKTRINSISALRSLLLITEDDSPEVKSYKKIFQQLGEIFIKYFSVNWIFNGRISNKLVHLKYRFRMLRRIRNPESFTYLK